MLGLYNLEQSKTGTSAAVVLGLYSLEQSKTGTSAAAVLRNHRTMQASLTVTKVTGIVGGIWKFLISCIYGWHSGEF